MHLLPETTVIVTLLAFAGYSFALRLQHDVVPNLLGEVIASVVAPLNVVANINPDEDGNGLVPNLLGQVSATVQASPTVTARIFDSGRGNSGQLLRREVPLATPAPPFK